MKNQKVINDCRRCSFFVRLRRPTRGHDVDIFGRMPYVRKEQVDDIIAICVFNQDQLKSFLKNSFFEKLLGGLFLTREDLDELISSERCQKFKIYNRMKRGKKK